MQDSPKEAPGEGAAKQAGDGLQVSGGVLDFSSGSEDDEDGRAVKRKMVTPGAADSSSSSGGNVASGPGRMSLLQHGFSKLLETVKRKAEGGDRESSSDVGGNPSGDESVDEQREDAPTTVCAKSSDESRPSKVAAKTWELSSGSETEGTGLEEAESRMKASPPRQSHDAVRRMQQKRRNPGPSRRCLENYSDESDDLDVATAPKNDKVGDKRGARSGSGRAGRGGGTAHRAHKSRYSEDIEMFTSSEDERAPAKRARPAGRRFTSPQNPVALEEPARTGPKAPTSPAIRGNIDSVLGRLPRARLRGALLKVDLLP